MALLEEIYRSFYYTPAPDGIGQQFRDEFLATWDKFDLPRTARVLLEIGASSGDALVELAKRTGASVCYAFEPNVENAELASARGIDVRKRFFTADVAGERLEPVDLIYARHVIEHVPSFEDFFAGVNAVTHPSSILILETPSLDFHAREGSLAPFHVEHVHVFALKSLATLARRHGWTLRDAEVTAPGNLIAAFAKGGSAPEAPAPLVDGLQRSVDEQQQRMRDLFSRRALIFWGAGSSGVGLVSMLGREPDVWTDGNPNKVGKHFVGLDSIIVSPAAALAAARSGELANPALIIASSFVDEILPRVRELGWSGDVFDVAGRRL
jgi:SAM-dependent methyltransferase